MSDAVGRSMSKSRAGVVIGCVAALAFFVWGESFSARPPIPPAPPAGAGGTVVIPERFLRRWDPVTVFFTDSRGPAGGGPEDQPASHASLSPAHPGQWRWIDGRTLQFSPADPWPALSRFQITAAGRRMTLATLMSPPRRTVPTPNARGLDPVESVSLTFPEPLDPEALARMASFELRPLPGVDVEGSRRLTGDDFNVKIMERKSPSDAATYVLQLKEPIPWGTRALVRLRLSLDDGPEKSFSELVFSTAEPFRVVTAGTDRTQLPLTVAGSLFDREQAIEGFAGAPKVVLTFSADPRAIGPVVGRNLLRFTPAVEGLGFHQQGRRLEVTGAFARETLYRLTLSPTSLEDTKGRPMLMEGESELFFSFPRASRYLQWSGHQGVIERYGPQMITLAGRGDERLDLRMYPVDPLDRSFWPFPDQPLAVDEAQRPPGPGEEPAPFTDPQRRVTVNHLRQLISALGSPPVSALVDLPLAREGSAATFGLDLKPHLSHLSGEARPGHYLVGIRRLDGSSQRLWRRVQVTDLSLAAVEEPRRVHFTVSSLSTGEVVPRATVRVEASVRARSSSRVTWETIFEGVTGDDGNVIWAPPGNQPATIQRVVVEKEGDRLVLDPQRPLEKFANNLWSSSRGRWLQWTQGHLGNRGEQEKWRAHLFPERPVYRPDEEVFIKGYVRLRHRGALSVQSYSGLLVVQGPGGMRWEYPLKPTREGSLAHTFKEKKLPTGAYTAHLELTNHGRVGHTSFRIEAYRVPRFEVRLHAPDIVPLDAPFQVSLAAEYYAGGRVEGRPLQWRVTQFPYAWTPSKRKGFFFSSDGRFSRTRRFESTPRLQREDATDEEGGALLTLDPAIEPTAQPRTYVIEATVTGADDQTVTATRQVRGLPPFVLGLKVPRYLEKVGNIEPEIIAVGPDGELLPGVEITARLLHRRWHSVLQAGDFSEGAAKYVTDVVDEKVREEKVTSAAEPRTLNFSLEEAGVYVVELEARDRLDRTQVVAVDLFAGGEEPVAWEKPEAGVFTVTPDKEKYEPGETAQLVLRSPFQKALALVVTEAPGGSAYSWLEVDKGQATFSLPVEKTFVPRVPVHVLLFRGRIPQRSHIPDAETDLEKPASLAATAWVEVSPVEHRVEVDLSHPEQALPGEEIDVTVRLRDARGAPLGGEVTLWLVDQAVLALGKEQPLDPLPDFITDPRSYLALSDSRRMVAGRIPYREHTGGGERKREAALEAERQGLLDRVTVRRRFKTVPYYNPLLMVGPGGEATVKISLPDNLTNFKLRAKAMSGPGRFGYGKGHLEVRLPLIVQPALPRFVRPGDRFFAAAVGRVVEGEGGPGRAQVRVEGATLDGPGEKELTWEFNVPQRVEFPLQVPTPPYNEEGELAYGEMVFKAAVERDADGASDGFEVRLPIRDDRERVTRRLLADLEPGRPLALPPVEEEPRPGSVRRSVLVSDQPALLRMAGGVSFIMSYPYGCTEQKVSRARVHLAMKKFRDILHVGEAPARLDRAVEDTLQWIAGTVNPSSGLVAVWPGGRGYVSLTAWVLQFLVEAREAGYQVEGELLDGFTRVLKQALRSDYSYFIDGEAFTERTLALRALAAAGHYNREYAGELARKAQFLSLEANSAVLLAAAGDQGMALSAIRDITERIREGIVVQLHQGEEMYGGLQEEIPRSGLILPSETRTVAMMARALDRVEADPERLQLLVDALVRLGRGDGWGTTNANAAALLALGEFLKPPFQGSIPRTVAIRLGGEETHLAVGPEEPVGYLVSTSAAAGEAFLAATAEPGVAVRAESSYIPAAEGSLVEPEARGFVVTRELLRIGEEDRPPEKIPLEEGGREVSFRVGEIVEEHLRVVNPEPRHYVAVVAPLAAGMEVLNPGLATAPPEAEPSGKLTLEPTYRAFLDDSAAFYYDTLPKGTYDFYFRARATTAGSFIQPPAKAEMMYNGSVRGHSAGARVLVERGTTASP